VKQLTSAFLATLLCAGAARADTTDQKHVIDGVLAALDKDYVFPAVAAKIRAALGHKHYDETGEALAEALTKDLQAISHDKHMRVGYSPDPIPEHLRDKPTPEELDRQRAFMRFVNAGFVKVERLDGNIGYLRLDGFADPSDGAETAAAAMSFLAGTSALIIDLRENHGGEPEMVALLVSYLYPADARVHINDIYTRTGNTTREYWTMPGLAGKRFTGKPVYVLTSGSTFSGGEELAYDVQTEKRGTIVGETTGGGANPQQPVRIDEHFFVAVPGGRAVNPVTKTNWEGTGVKPDIAAPAAKALDVAYKAALEDVKKTLAGKPVMAREVDEALKKLSAS
jgi:C-terminal processing protease CtpA/Prc